MGVFVVLLRGITRKQKTDATETSPIRSLLPSCHYRKNKYIQRILRTPGPVTVPFAPKCTDAGTHGKHLQQSILETLVLTYIDLVFFVPVHRSHRFVIFDPVDERNGLHVTSKNITTTTRSSFPDWVEKQNTYDVIDGRQLLT